MAKVKLNPILEGVRGKVGDLVFKSYNDEVLIARKPDQSSIEPSSAQIAQRERFSQAVLYGKTVMADPETKAIYEAAARRKGKPVFSLTVADFFKAPSVDLVDLGNYAGAPGDEIHIRASDDFAVSRVMVAISDADGNAIESGEASQALGEWVYTATEAVSPGTVVRILVTAVDRPGGTGEREQEVTI